jgi:hypothetical protein
MAGPMIRDTIPPGTIVIDAPRSFYLEIDHYRAGVWLGTTFTRGGYGVTYLPIREGLAAW